MATFFSQSNTSTAIASLQTTRVVRAAATLLAGVMFIALVGFAPMMAVHNAAHDTRHRTGYPCH